MDIIRLELLGYFPCFFLASRNLAYLGVMKYLNVPIHYCFYLSGGTCIPSHACNSHFLPIPFLLQWRPLSSHQKLHQNSPITSQLQKLLRQWQKRTKPQSPQIPHLWASGTNRGHCESDWFFCAFWIWNLSIFIPLNFTGWWTASLKSKTASQKLTVLLPVFHFILD